MRSILRKVLIDGSHSITAVLVLLSVVGFYLGTGLQLKLSLADLLPEKHPSVLRFEELTKVVGGIGYLTIILHAEDGQSHLDRAPRIVEQLKQSPLVRSAFFYREQRFFVDRMLYYMDLDRLKSLDESIRKQIRQFKRQFLDLGLSDESKEEGVAPKLDDELKDAAQKSAAISPYLISKDKKDLLIMVKPSFDSMEVYKNKELIRLADQILQHQLPPAVTHEYSGRYFSKLADTEIIQGDIVVLGILSVLCIALILYFTFRSFRALCAVFFPVFLGLGITMGITRLWIGQITVITGFLMGILSGLGVDYAIHLLLRLSLEHREPSSNDPDPIWRTLVSSGHSVFVGAIAASFSFFLMGFSSFRAFSEFGIICGIGIASVFICLILSFRSYVKFLRIENNLAETKRTRRKFELPTLKGRLAYRAGIFVTLGLCAWATQVRFEYNFDKMLQHSKRVQRLMALVDEIYERSVTPSAFAVMDKQQALDVEKMLKKKYMPSVVNQMISGASIIPEDQAEKQKTLRSIKEAIANVKDSLLKRALNIPANVIRDWVDAKPFTFEDLPAHIQDALRGTGQGHYLIYLYPAIHMNNAQGVKTYANMVKDVEGAFPEILTGSDAVIFSDILDLIKHDGIRILAVIFVALAIFIWINTRSLSETMLCYIPLVIALPVGVGLMALFGVRFNIFNISIIPTFVAMGIDVPIHIVHRAKEVRSGFKSASDLSASIHLALATAGVGFGVLVFARAGVLQSLGWIALLGTLGIWWAGLFLLPAYLERVFRDSEISSAGIESKVYASQEPAEKRLQPPL